MSKVLNHLNISVDEFQMMDRINFSKSIRIKNVLQDFPQASQIDILDDEFKPLFVILYPVVVPDMVPGIPFMYIWIVPWE